MVIFRYLGMVSLVFISLVMFSFTAQSEAFKLKGKAKPVKIYFNVKNDGGWVQAHDEARIKMEKALGMKIPYVEKIPEVASELKPAVDKFVKRGYNIIMASAFGYSDALKELAEKYPDVAFVNAAGTTNNGKNLMSYYGRTYESQYLCGMVAGAMTKTGKIGFVAAVPIGLVNWTVNGYLMGARQMNPNVTLTVVYTGGWYDPVKERAAAEALAEKGIDVIGQHVDTPTPQIVAGEKGIYSTGHHRDMSEFSKSSVCSSVWVWDRFLTPTVKQIVSGKWEPSEYGAFEGLGSMTDIALTDDVPEDIAKKVMAERQAIIDGKNIWEGPIVDQSGKVRVPEGKSASVGDLWGMDYLIKGVIGTTK